MTVFYLVRMAVIVIAVVIKIPSLIVYEFSDHICRFTVAAECLYYKDARDRIAPVRDAQIQFFITVIQLGGIKTLQVFQGVLFVQSVVALAAHLLSPDQNKVVINYYMQYSLFLKARGAFPVIFLKAFTKCDGDE